MHAMHTPERRQKETKGDKKETESKTKGDASVKPYLLTACSKKETERRQKGDKKETERRQKIDKRETNERYKRDKRQAEKRQKKRDRKETQERRKGDKKETERRQTGDALMREQRLQANTEETPEIPQRQKETAKTKQIKRKPIESKQKNR